MRAVSQRIRSDGRFFRDAEGNVILLRGVNLSGRSKQPPFIPLQDPSLLDPLPKWGFNVVRLLLTWEGVEPRPGEYDEKYLDAMVELATNAQARGLAVLVDMHQDIFARAFGGDGAPSWVVGRDETPPPDRRWFLRYFTSRHVRRAQREFWTDRRGHRTHFMGALRRVMERMRDVDAVVGYDTWNEPMSGLRHVLSGWFERKILTDFFAECGRLRDEVDPQRLIFAEPSPLAALGAPSFLRLPKADGFVYAPHVYDSAAITLGRYLPQASTFPRTMSHHLDVSRRLDAPLFIGEFGVLNWVRGGQQMMEHECRFYDRHFASWAAWHYNPTEQDWNDENASIVEPDASPRAWATPLFRPFPQTLAGEPRSWESKSGEPWSLEYAARAGGTTEIVVPRVWSEAPEVDIKGAEHEWQDDHLLVRATEAGPVRVTMRRHAG